jgi:hypothetical protein
MNFKTLSRKLDNLTNRLDRLISVMEDFSSRGLKIIRQQKHSISSRDMKFDGDFNKFCSDSKKFAKDLGIFFTAAGLLQRKLKSEALQYDVMTLKAFVTKARELNLTIEEFGSVFNYLKKNIKDNKPQLKWWILEVASADIQHLSGKILFAAREISHIAEKISI